MQLRFWSGALRQYVAQAQIAHAKMRILWRARSHKPWSAGHIRSLRDQQQSAVLRVLPECLGPVNRAFLYRTICSIRRLWCAEAGKTSRYRVRRIEEEVPLSIHAAIVEAELYAQRNFYLD